MLGALYIGTAKFESDPYSSFANNVPRIRCEINVLFHVRKATGPANRGDLGSRRSACRALRSARRSVTGGWG
jgi:hypothetical protein